MAGTIVADTIRADSTSTLVLRNGVANTPPTIQDNAGTQIGTFCRAWVNFDGTNNVGGFCTIRGSFNVTTVADNGTGDYTVNFTNALPDANYSVVLTGNQTTAGNAVGGTLIYGTGTPATMLTTSVRVNSGNTSTGTLLDRGVISVAIFR
jgi:hypothetical protein